MYYTLHWIYENQNYFKKRNVKYLKSTPLLGALKDLILSKSSLLDNIVKNYNTPHLKREPYYGMFILHKTVIAINDPELVKRILITDFQSFNSRMAESGMHDPIGYYHPFMCSYATWKKIRQNLSKFFTAAKFKSAFHLLEKSGEDLQEYINEQIVNDRVEFPIKYITELFFVGVFTSMALGIESKSFKKSENEFHKVAISMWEKSFKRSLDLGSFMIFPEIVKILKPTIMGKYADNFFYTVGSKIIEEREKSGQKRNDLIDILIGMKKDIEPEAPGHTIDHILISQMATFLQAGFETTSTTMAFAFYELSKNQQIQNRLRKEIQEALVENNGKLSYETLTFPSKMPYLHMVLNETLRLYHSVPVLERKCTNPEGYSLEPFGTFHIPYGMSIFVPIFAIARDEKYFPEPLKFDPERFRAENIHKIPSCSNIPFGAGPHNCVGQKLALIEAKFIICCVLKSFRVVMTERTPKEITFDKNSLSVGSAEEIFLGFVKDPVKN